MIRGKGKSKFKNYLLFFISFSVILFKQDVSLFRHSGNVDFISVDRKA